MPKAKKKAKKAAPKAKAPRTVTCGKCKEQGHNARTCTTGKSKEIKSSADIPPPPITGSKTKVDMRHEQTKRRMSPIPKRDAPTADSSGSHAAPYRCSKCNAVAVLVVVRVKDHDASFKQKKEIYKGEQRCEKCMNKPAPAELILKWGATPDEVVPVPGQDD